MQQHPVPQNVTQYQFRLVGDMTLKQFLELAGGLLITYLFFASNLITILKYPLALFSAIFSFGLAFFPIEDRPLDVWIINFLKSIYRPTRFIWKKSTKIPALFTFQPHPVVQNETVTKTIKAPPPSSSSSLIPQTDLSQEDRLRLDALNTLFSKIPTLPSKSPPPPSPLSGPKPSISVRKLSPLSSLGSTPIYQSSSPPHSPSANSTQPSPLTSNPIVSPPPAESTIFSAPSVKQVKIDPSLTPADNIALPAPPSSPNLVVGMVVDNQGKIVENAIVQIVNNESVPQRAIKTNSLGQFYTSTPLSVGTYLLEVEKEGFTFPSKKLLIENKVISPLLLRASV